MWAQLADILSGGDAQQILYAIPPESQQLLRQSYDARPLSFEAAIEKPLRAALVSWVEKP
jgi:hypothetical protein